ncbi:hypothetical protein FGIG_02999 [Fasciola gigantica]|uniref:Uncharacterized protein n=1 Tax=Fasciola gigantica TaxID=46835 RepID=A0A504YI52_FASGI|nr:hypothetical protein FGIG_02999 [Fasciola gigantica]
MQLSYLILFFWFVFRAQNPVWCVAVRDGTVNITKWLKMKPNKNLPEVMHQFHEFAKPMFFELPNFQPQLMQFRRYTCYVCTGCRVVTPSVTLTRSNCYECVMVLNWQYPPHRLCNTNPVTVCHKIPNARCCLKNLCNSLSRPTVNKILLMATLLVAIIYLLNPK